MSAHAGPDLVNRCFVAQGPNQLWVADMTYVPTGPGSSICRGAHVWSRRVVGWAIGEHMTVELVLSALNMAGTQRASDSFTTATRQPVHSIALAPAARRWACALDGSTATPTTTPWRELLRQPGMRADRPTQFQDQDRGAPGALYLDRGLVQTRAGATPHWVAYPNHFERSHLDTAFAHRSIPERGLPTAPLASARLGPAATPWTTLHREHECRLKPKR